MEMCGVKIPMGKNFYVGTESELLERNLVYSCYNGLTANVIFYLDGSEGKEIRRLNIFRAACYSRDKEIIELVHSKFLSYHTPEEFLIAAFQEGDIKVLNYLIDYHKIEKVERTDKCLDSIIFDIGDVMDKMKLLLSLTDKPIKGKSGHINNLGISYRSLIEDTEFYISQVKQGKIFIPKFKLMNNIGRYKQNIRDTLSEFVEWYNWMGASVNNLVNFQAFVNMENNTIGSRK